MGSQTLEILRQGFWASFTGGWFFDPRQEIFCNTFHLYLWMYLILLPFILFLTTGESSISLVLYPTLIFVTFTIIKIANIRLHYMFDGEEIGEAEEIKDRDVEEGTDGVTDATIQDGESKKVEFNEIELDVLNASKVDKDETNEKNDDGIEENSCEKDKSTVSLQELENKTILEVANSALVKDGDAEFLSNKDDDGNSVLSGSSTCSLWSFSSNGGRAELVVVDVHKNTEECKDKKSNAEQLVMQEAFEGIKSEEPHEICQASALDDKVFAVEERLNKKVAKLSKIPSLERQEGQVVDDLSINADQLITSQGLPFVGESQDTKENAGDLETIETGIDAVSQSTQAPNCGSYHENPDFHPLVKQGIERHESYDSANFLEESKKECSDKKLASNETQEKALSLSALESSPSNQQSLDVTGKGTRNNQGVWFSLPEMESTSSTKENIGSQNAISDDPAITSVLPSRLLNEISLEDVDSERQKEDAKSETESETRHESAEELLDTYDRRRLHRRGATRQSFRDVVRERSSIRQRRNRSSLLGGDDDGNDHLHAVRHVAVSHEDTSAGAVHCFKDEFGVWHTYVFGDEGGTDADVHHLPSTDHSIGSSALLRDLLRTSSRRGAESSSTPASLTDRELFDSVYQDMRLSQLLTGGLESRTSTGLSQFASPGSLKVSVSEPPPRRYYKLYVNKSFFIKIWFDRLALLALLDRNKSLIEAVVAVFFATLTAFFGYMLLSCENIYDIWTFILCFVVAKCQFSLLKSVQPDSASPVHGHNNVIVFSRAGYFCLLSGMILLIDQAIKTNPSTPTLYGVQLSSRNTLEFTRDALIAFILAFPVIFVLGLLPQINTFIMYITEQLDVHIFGGTSMTSILAAFYSMFKSIISVCFLYGFCFAAMKTQSKEQHILFSIYSGLLVAVSYHLSRCTSDPTVLWELFKSKILRIDVRDEEGDPLPEKLRKTVLKRLGNDVIVSTGIIIIVFSVHVSTMFTVLQPTVTYILFVMTAIFGVINHYVIPQLRKELPWLIASSPVLKSAEYDLFEARDAARIMWFERVYIWLCAIERNILYPLTFINCITRYAPLISDKFGLAYGSLVITITGMKLLRSNFTSTSRQHVILIWTVLFFEFDYRNYSETFPIDYFIMSVFVDKAIDLLLKLRFILTYIAPWQITWGSAFHAFAQPFSIPHCGMLFLQAVVSAFVSAPLNPFLGSAIFITSYVRPAKFWEKNYNTKRSDHSNTRLSSHLDNNPCSDDNNLNSIFYEHLTRSLQHSLCGDLSMGRWGNVNSGDFFFIASDYLNALVHIIEFGNGFVTFQLRGLEFRGTYCQQRELEAITEWADSDGSNCCCCSSCTCNISRLLSCKSAFNQRWLAWEVIQTKYTLEGYSVSDNTATSMFQVFDLRKIFITYYVKAIIYYALKSCKLKSWTDDESLMNSLSETRKPSFVDRDAVFRAMTDEDYDSRLNGVSLSSFCSVYLPWVRHCNDQLKEPVEDCDKDSNLLLLCFALSLLGRRMFFTVAHQPATTLKSFLHGLHALFKGDFRVSSTKDEWVFADPDMELLRKVISPAVKMSVKLHQDHFTCPDEYDDNTILYDAISSHNQNLVISHEGDPIWRQAVLNNKPSLLALRYVIDEGNDDYKIIMLNKRYLNFRVVKVNRECVRGLWAGQLQELIFLRNRNPERGSIQNAKQALRNMINSSCDQPIGYPIYVSPLTTSYMDTNDQITQIIGGPFTFNLIGRFASWLYQRLANRYGGACNPNSSTEQDDIETAPAVVMPTFSYDPKIIAPPQLRSTSQRSSYTAVPNSSRRHSSSTSTVVVPPSSSSKRTLHECQRVSLVNSCLSLDPSSSGLKHLQWPSIELKEFVQRDIAWQPMEGLEFDIIHRFDEPRYDVKHRSEVTETILLIKSKDKHLLIPESGVKYLSKSEIV